MRRTLTLAALVRTRDCGIAVLVGVLFTVAACSGGDAEQRSVETIRTSIQRYQSYSHFLKRDPLLPAKLDSAPAGTVAAKETPLFTEVIPEGVTAGWKKVGANRYVFGKAQEANAKPEDVYRYEPRTGNFVKGSEPSL